MNLVLLYSQGIGAPKDRRQADYCRNPHAFALLDRGGQRLELRLLDN
jgi:hypothetical protein